MPTCSRKHHPTLSSSSRLLLTTIITTTTTTAFSTTPTATFYSEDYERLGVGRSATKPEIKTAYYNKVMMIMMLVMIMTMVMIMMVKAKELHPDTNTSGSGDEVEFLIFPSSLKALYSTAALSMHSRFM